MRMKKIYGLILAMLLILTLAGCGAVAQNGDVTAQNGGASGEGADISFRTAELKEVYALEQHSEGGWFSEVYTAPFENDGRSYAGSIYFLLDAGEISHLHWLDCDEIWYYHEGCGMKITVLTDEGKEELLLGSDTKAGQRGMAVIPAGAMFAAENIDEDGYTFISCATTPKFTYDGFHLVDKAELQATYPDLADELSYLAYE